jgi:hypothetical protein
LADSLYQIGSHELRMEILTNGSDAGPFSAFGTVEVVPEGNIGSWWRWDPNTTNGASWKDDYQLSGSISNGSFYVGMDLSLELLETDNENNERSIATISQELASSGTATLTFPPINHDWPWLVQGIWTPETAEIGKPFEYAVNVSGSDKYGNTYSASKSSSHSVEVNVSDKKLGLAFNAFNAQASAIGLTIAAAATFLIPPLAAALAAAAAAAGIAAAILGGLALDPPKPNKRYLRAVRIPRVPSFDSRFSKEPAAAIGHFFWEVSHAGACLMALSETQSRILGARRDGSQKGLALQKEGLKKLLTEMMALTASLTTAGAAATEAYKNHYASQLRSALTGAAGPALRRHVGKLPVRRSLKETTIRILSDPAARKTLAKREVFPLMFAAISGRLARLLKEYADELDPYRRTLNT